MIVPDQNDKSQRRQKFCVVARTFAAILYSMVECPYEKVGVQELEFYAENTVLHVEYCPSDTLVFGHYCRSAYAGDFANQL